MEKSVVKSPKARKPMKILFVAAEAAPYASIGGLGQVIYFLSRTLRKMGHDVRVMIPKYAHIDESFYQTEMVKESLQVLPGGRDVPIICNVKLHRPSRHFDAPVYFFENMEYYEKRANVYGYIDDHVRFAVFSKGVLSFLRESDWVPDVINSADWQTGHLPNYLRTTYRSDPGLRKIATVFSIHNLHFQGMFDHRFVSELEYDDGKSSIAPFFAEKSESLRTQNFMKRGILHSDIVNTVSENHAREILTPEYGEKLDHLLGEVRTKLYGVLNGLDYKEFDPATDKIIYANYSVKNLDIRLKNKLALQREFNLPENQDIPVFGMVGRLDEQKGFDILIPILYSILSEYDIQLVVIGGGDGKYHSGLVDLQRKFPKKLATHLTPNFTLPRHVFAGADIFLIPSKFEPFGITAIEAMRYGSVPVARRTGGLADTVRNYDPATDTGNGFVFNNYDHLSLYGAIVRALEVYKNPQSWRGIMKRAMRTDFSWDNSAKRYEELYEKAVALAKGRSLGKVHKAHQSVF
jgi:starch synthase